MAKSSLLTPSRNRYDLLVKSLASLGDHDFEFLVVTDPDEPDERYKSLSPPRIVAPKRWGYQELHKYYNLLARRATADWIMLWNDDAIMLTPDWFDLIVAQDASKPVVLTVFHPINNLFPVISRPFYDILGHFSLNTHADSWVQQVGERSGTQVYVPGIEILHNKPADDTGQQSNDVTLQTGAQFNSIETQTLINADASKVKGAL